VNWTNPKSEIGNQKSQILYGLFTIFVLLLTLNAANYPFFAQNVSLCGHLCGGGGDFATNSPSVVA
jgi:hypothetical protein